MSAFRSRENRRTLWIFAAVSAVFVLIAFLWDIWFGVFTSVLCVCLACIFLIHTEQRCRKIANLSEEIDLMLHDDAHSFAFDRCSEGELSILQAEIYKMTVRIREQNERLKEDKIYLSDSIADISHQIRTPLTSINLLVELLSAPQISEDRKRELLRKLMTLLSGIDWLISALLKLSKLDAKTVQFKKETTALDTLLRQAAEPLLIPIELREQTLSITADGFCICDRLWTKEAVSNILKNCMEHSGIGGAISVHAEENPLFSEIVIADHGPGIDEEDLSHIFERFYKGKHADHQSYGIGLALSRMILAEQNGTIKAENASGGGARFVIRLYKGTV